MAAHSTAGNAGRLMLLTDVHHEEERAQLEQLSAIKRGYPTVRSSVRLTFTAHRMCIHRH